VHFEAQAVDPDGPPSGLSYRWDFGDGGAQFGRTAQHTYLEPGTFTARVTATDAGGATATAQTEIKVANPPGNAAPSVEALADPRSGAAPLRVRFSSAATDPDGDQLLSVWDFGDGVKAGGEAATHTYTQPGTYNAKVTVTDPGGKSATATVAVTVSSTRAQASPPAAADDGDVAGESETSSVVRLTKTHKLARVVKRGLRYSVACESACRVSSVLRVAGKRLGASSARRIAAGHSRAIVVRLDRAGRRRLASKLRVTATILTTIQTADGTRTLRTRVVLRR
jgi:chitodextrinase